VRTALQSCVCLLLLFGLSDLPAAAADDASDIFARRILPLAQADQPSSCRECHVAGIDLSQYIRSDAGATFAALRAAGLVNADQPEKSKLLEFIARAPEKGNPVLAKVRTEELAAFTAWITAAAKDPRIASAQPSGEPIGPALPKEIIRHARLDRVLQSFVENLWIERERCAGCHSPDKNQRVVKNHGEQVSWIVPDDPAATLATIIDHELIDIDDPDKSLILQKPLNQVDHGGHIKFALGSRTDKQFRRFLHDYAATVTGKYHSASDLPKQPDEVVVATAQHLRLTDVPSEFGGKLARIDLYRWSEAGWSSRPVATVDGRTNLKNGQFQGVVFASMPRTIDIAKEVERRRQFPEGRYRARLYVDREEKASRNRDYELGQADLIGDIEFDGPWPAGYQPPKILSASAASPRPQP
jgi:hypothetical protein